VRLLKKQVSEKKKQLSRIRILLLYVPTSQPSHKESRIQQLDDCNIRKTLKNLDLSMSYLFKVLDFFVNRANITFHEPTG